MLWMVSPGLSTRVWGTIGVVLTIGVLLDFDILLDDPLLDRKGRATGRPRSCGIPGACGCSPRKARHLRIHRCGWPRLVGDVHAELHHRGVVDPREARERLDRVAQHLERDVCADCERRLLQPLTGFGPERIGAGQSLAV